MRLTESRTTSRPGERWKRIPAFPDYEASNQGRIRRAKDAAGTQQGRVLKPRVVRGYLRVDLRKYRASYNKGVASLVAEAWIGPCPDGWVVTHKDGDRENNTPTNVEYVSRGEAVSARMPKRNSQAKLTPDDVREIRRLYKGTRTERGWSGAEIAREYDISISAALSAAQGKTWQGVA